MGILISIIIGFIVGIVARALKPGDNSMGFLLTTLVGIVGAVLGGYIGQAMGIYQVGEPAGFVASVIGAIIVLFAMSFVRRTV